MSLYDKGRLQGFSENVESGRNVVAVNLLSPRILSKEFVMNIHPNTPFQRAIEAVEILPLDDRELLLETLRMRAIEDRRDQIAVNAWEAREAVRNKRAFFGSVDDLRKDLLGDAL